MMKLNEYADSDIGLIILGVCIILAVVIFVQPQFATPVFNFLSGLLWVCVVVVIVVLVIIGIVIFLVVKS